MLNRPCAAGDSEVLTAAGHWASRARRIARRLSFAAEAGWMSDVGDGPATLQMSSLFRNDPVYHRFFRLWQDMNLGLAALFGDFLQMPLARTFELYELWCFLRLLRAAVQEYDPGSLNLQDLFITDKAGGVTIAAGAITVGVGQERVICFQRQYQEYWIEPGGEGSFTRNMVPDIVLASHKVGNPDRQVIVLDAKYRINDGLNDAVSSIHTYRDAIVQEAESGQVKGIVNAAYLLTPHIPSIGAEFTGTPIPGRLFHPVFRQKFRFGAITLRPGMSAAELRYCLITIVSDSVVTIF